MIMANERAGIIERMKRGRLLFDGGMGTMLIADGLEPGACPEQWNRDRPKVVRDIHAAYLDAGSEVITTNTFGATPSRLEGYGLGREVGAINNNAVDLAWEAIAASGAHTGNYVALSVGPTGKMLPPVGKANESEIEAEFGGQLQSLEQPVDLVLGETFFDLREALARGARTSRRAGDRLGWRRRLLPRDLLEGLFEGYDLALRRIDAVLDSHAVQPIECEGRRVDPERMRVVALVACDGVPPGHVADVVRRGYVRGRRVIRCAEVRAVAATSSNGSPVRDTDDDSLTPNEQA